MSGFNSKKSFETGESYSNYDKLNDDKLTPEKKNQIISTLNGLLVLMGGGGQHESGINQDHVKFLKDIDYIKCKLGEFDAKQININVWFKRFECLSVMLGWSCELRADALLHLLGPALDRLSQEKKKKIYEMVKKDTINLVDELLIQCGDIVSHLRHKVIPIFEGNVFTNPEKRYWLECIASPEYYRTYRAELKNEGLDKLISLVI